MPHPALKAAVVALLPAAAAQPNFFFIGVPPYGSGISQDDIDQGLSDIADVLIDNRASR